MKPTLIEIEEDFVRSDMIAAVTVDFDDTENDEAYVLVYLIGFQEPLKYFQTKLVDAEKLRVETVKKWLNAL